MAHEVKTFVVQFEDSQPLQYHFDRLDRMVQSLGAICVHSIQDTVHNNEPEPSPHAAEFGFRIWPGNAAIARIIVFTRDRP